MCVLLTFNNQLMLFVIVLLMFQTIAAKTAILLRVRQVRDIHRCLQQDAITRPQQRPQQRLQQSAVQPQQQSLLQKVGSSRWGRPRRRNQSPLHSVH